MNAQTVVLIGAGPMAEEYARTLTHLDAPFRIKGRGQESAERFTKSTGLPVSLTWDEIDLDFSNCVAIVAVDEAGLWASTEEALSLGFGRVLVEKPGGPDIATLTALETIDDTLKSRVSIAYNRRFYKIVEILRHNLQLDGGVTSALVDFSERSKVIEPLVKSPGVKENWFIHNSTHVLDTFLHICGEVKLDFSQVAGSLPWHPSGAVFSGTGRIGETEALFSYLADWVAPAGWEITIRSKKRKFLLKPLEVLTITDHLGNSEVFHEVDFSQGLKPGLLQMVRAFLSDTDASTLVSLQQQINNMALYSQIANGPEQHF